MVEWIITDLDGTLIDHEEITYNLKYDDFTIAFWNQLVNSKKYKFSIATGRHYINVLDLNNQMGLKLPDDGFIVGMNGAQIYSCKDKKLIFKHLFEESEILKIDLMINHLENKYADKYMIMGYQDTDKPIFFYHNKKTTSFMKWMNQMCEYENSTVDFESTMIDSFNEVNKIYKLVIVFRTKFDHKQEETILSKIFPNMSFVKSGDEFIEMFPSNINKKLALEKINEQHYNIDPKNVLIFGDSFNDYEMLKWAGMSVTRSSTDIEIQDVCKYVIDSPASTFVADGLTIVLNR